MVFITLMIGITGGTPIVISEPTISQETLNSALFSGELVNKDNRGLDKATIILEEVDSNGSPEYYSTVTDAKGQFALRIPSSRVWDMKIIYNDNIVHKEDIHINYRDSVKYKMFVATGGENKGNIIIHEILPPQTDARVIHKFNDHDKYILQKIDGLNTILYINDFSIHNIEAYGNPFLNKIESIPIDRLGLNVDKHDSFIGSNINDVEQDISSTSVTSDHVSYHVYNDSDSIFQVKYDEDSYTRIQVPDGYHVVQPDGSSIDKSDLGYDPIDMKHRLRITNGENNIFYILAGSGYFDYSMFNVDVYASEGDILTCIYTDDSKQMLQYSKMIEDTQVGSIVEIEQLYNSDYNILPIITDSDYSVANMNTSNDFISFDISKHGDKKTGFVLRSSEIDFSDIVISVNGTGIESANNINDAFDISSVPKQFSTKLNGKHHAILVMPDSDPREIKIFPNLEKTNGENGYGGSNTNDIIDDSFDTGRNSEIVTDREIEVSKKIAEEKKSDSDLPATPGFSSFVGLSMLCLSLLVYKRRL